MEAKETVTQATAMLQIFNTKRLVVITGIVSALCLTACAALLGDETAKEPQNRAATLEDLLGKIIEEGTAALLSSLDVKTGLEKSLWKTVMSPESLTPEELKEFDGNVDRPGVLAVQLIVPSQSDASEKRRLVPLAPDVPVQVSYDVLKRKVDQPLASMYYIDVRQPRNPRVQLAAFFVFDVEKQTWNRVPSSR